MAKSDELDTAIPAGTTIKAKFSVSLTRVQTSKAILSWNATAYQLKNVTGTIYCKNTGVLFSRTYYSSSIKCPHLDGTTNRASNATASFTIESSSKGTASYKVGFSNVILKTITKDYNMTSGYSIVEK